MDFIKKIADTYGLPFDFVFLFYGKVEDKWNFVYGIRMFLDGWITMDTVTMDSSINIGEWQEKYVEARKRQMLPQHGMK